jgi:predicted Na+-dependent transporter
MLLVLTNTIAVFIAPFLIKAMLSSKSSGISLNSTGLLINLVITVLAPSVVGKVAPCSFHGAPDMHCL